MLSWCLVLLFVAFMILTGKNAFVGLSVFLLGLSLWPLGHTYYYAELIVLHIHGGSLDSISSVGAYMVIGLVMGMIAGVLMCGIRGIRPYLVLLGLVAHFLGLLLLQFGGTLSLEILALVAWAGAGFAMPLLISSFEDILSVTEESAVHTLWLLAGVLAVMSGMSMLKWLLPTEIGMALLAAPAMLSLVQGSVWCFLLLKMRREGGFAVPGTQQWKVVQFVWFLLLVGLYGFASGIYEISLPEPPYSRAPSITLWPDVEMSSFLLLPGVLLPLLLRAAGLRVQSRWLAAGLSLGFVLVSGLLMYFFPATPEEVPAMLYVLSWLGILLQGSMLSLVVLHVRSLLPTQWYGLGVMLSGMAYVLGATLFIAQREGMDNPYTMQLWLWLWALLLALLFCLRLLREAVD